MKFKLLLIALLLTACGNKESALPDKVLRSALTQVVGGQAGNSRYEYSGEVRARHEVALGFRVAGKLAERLVETGERVKKGQTLARIDPADSALQANAAQAQYQFAESDARRYRDLHARGFVSQSALDVKETALALARSQLGLTRNQSEYTVLKADHDGVIAATLAEAGQVLSSGQAVLRLAQADEMEVAIDIPEARFAQHHVGDSAEVELLTGEGGAISGRLRELSLYADPVSRTYSARIALRAATTQPVLGMTARVRFEGGQVPSNELLIPLSAIYQQGRQAAVWIVSADHRVSLRQIDVKAYRDNGAVIGRGLVAGERIVSAGVHRLSAGEKIQIIESAK